MFSPCSCYPGPGEMKLFIHAWGISGKHSFMQNMLKITWLEIKHLALRQSRVYYY